jgi:hypothetical protein
VNGAATACSRLTTVIPDWATTGQHGSCGSLPDAVGGQQVSYLGWYLRQRLDLPVQLDVRTGHPAAVLAKVLADCAR